MSVFDLFIFDLFKKYKSNLLIKYNNKKNKYYNHLIF